MRQHIVAGNWKMNNDLNATNTLLSALKEQQLNANVEVIVAPTFVNLSAAVAQTAGTQVQVAAQNMHQEASGAYTGEISAEMLKGVGVQTVILGHSERRAYFHEDDALLAKKVSAAIAAGLRVIFCFGEELEDRQKGNHFNVVARQLKGGVFHLIEEAWSKVVLAYEPVWAIGTGETASPEQAQEMHAFIRKTLTDKYGETLAEGVSILYGGSVKPANASEIFGKTDVDGGLIGGASLDAASFAAIVNSF